MAVGKAMKRVRAATLVLAGVAVTLVAVPSGARSQAIAVYNESAGDALARNVHILAASPKDFNALIGAGKASLQIGDTQAAAGFFGRAAEINSASPLPLAGMGAAMVAMGDPNGALTYFARAQRQGAKAATFGCDRGLAYDLLGKQTAAQTDYRAALAGSDRDEARRRLALSLAISGNKALALDTLQPLLQRRDVGAQRVRALVLALSGDLIGAKSALDFTMPGASARMDPFFRRLPALSNVQKAAAVHLGIFPETGMSMASAGSGAARQDRLESIEQVLAQARQATSPQPVQAVAPVYGPQQAVSQPQPARTAWLSRPSVQPARTLASSPNNHMIETRRVASDPDGPKIWLQLATGTQAQALPGQFERIRAREPSLFTGLSGYLAEGSRARLLIGPFHSYKDANIFADALASANIRASSWTSDPGQVVRKLSNQ